MNDNTPRFLSTAAAAKMLGLSTTLIQSLVDKNELHGWKTRGGHRRIALQSIHDYQSNARMIGTSSRAKTPPKVTVVVERPDTLSLLSRQSSSWEFPVSLTFVDSITEALLNLGSDRPDQLVVELAMPKLQQEKTLQALENFNTRGHPISMVLVTEESSLRNTSTENNHSIQLIPGPLSEVWLHAYLTGVVATCRS